jgi:hypothetical protein
MSHFRFAVEEKLVGVYGIDDGGISKKSSCGRIRKGEKWIARSLPSN